MDDKTAEVERQRAVAIRRRTIENAKDEAKAIRRRLAQFLTEYGATGAQLLTWNEDQDISQGETRLAEFELRVVQ